MTPMEIAEPVVTADIGTTAKASMAALLKRWRRGGGWHGDEELTGAEKVAPELILVTGTRRELWRLQAAKRPVIESVYALMEVSAP